MFHIVAIALCAAAAVGAWGLMKDAVRLETARDAAGGDAPSSDSSAS